MCDDCFFLEKLIPFAENVYPVRELVFMFDAVQNMRPECIFEWGTHVGRSARIFHEIAKYLELDVEIYSTDLPNDVDHSEHAKSETGKLVWSCNNVFLNRGDGLERTLELYEDIKPVRCLVFIDGDHSYESVKRELEGIVTGIPEACILLHDTCYTTESGFNIGPYLAVQSVLRSYPNYKMTTTEGFPGMILLWPC